MATVELAGGASSSVSSGSGAANDPAAWTERVKQMPPVDALRETIWLLCGGSQQRIANVFDPSDSGEVTAASLAAGLRLLDLPVAQITGCRDASNLFRFLDTSKSGVVAVSSLFRRPLHHRVPASVARRPADATAISDRSDASPNHQGLRRSRSERMMQHCDGSQNDLASNCGSVGSSSAASSRRAAGPSEVVQRHALGKVSSAKELRSMRTPHRGMVEAQLAQRRSEADQLRKKIDELRNKQLVSPSVTSAEEVSLGRARLDDVESWHQRELAASEIAMQVAAEDEQRAASCVRGTRERLQRLVETRRVAECQWRAAEVDVVALEAEHAHASKSRDEEIEAINQAKQRVEAMTDLSYEAQRLTENLEYEAGMLRTQLERRAQDAESESETRALTRRLLLDELRHVKVEREEELESNQAAVARLEVVVQNLECGTPCMEEAEEVAACAAQRRLRVEAQQEAEFAEQEAEDARSYHSATLQVLNGELEAQRKSVQRRCKIVTAEGQKELELARQAHERAKKRMTEAGQKTQSDGRRLRIELDAATQRLSTTRKQIRGFEREAEEHQVAREKAEEKASLAAQELPPVQARCRRLQKELEAERQRSVVGRRITEEALAGADEELAEWQSRVAQLTALRRAEEAAHASERRRTRQTEETRSQEIEALSAEIAKERVLGEHLAAQVVQEAEVEEQTLRARAMHHERYACDEITSLLNELAVAQSEAEELEPLIGALRRSLELGASREASSVASEEARALAAAEISDATAVVSRLEDETEAAEVEVLVEAAEARRLSAAADCTRENEVKPLRILLDVRRRVLEEANPQRESLAHDGGGCLDAMLVGGEPEPEARPAQGRLPSLDSRQGVSPL